MEVASVGSADGAAGKGIEMIPMRDAGSECRWDDASLHASAKGDPARVSWRRRGVARAPEPYTTWPANPDSVGPARREVVDRARAAGATEAMLDDVALAVGEACTNSVVHAYVADGVHGEAFAVSTAVRRGRFNVWVRDEGRGMAPARTERPGLGLGLRVMHQLCDKLVIGVADEGVTQVQMQFALKQPQAVGARPQVVGA